VWCAQTVSILFAMSAGSRVVRRVARACAVLCGLVLITPIAAGGRQLSAEPAWAAAREQDRARADRALAEAVAVYSEWLGPAPVAAFSLVGCAPPAFVAGAPGRIHVCAPWRAAPGAMDIEAQVAFGAARWWLHPAADTQPDAIVDAAASYLQSRIVERLFERQFGREGYRHELVRFFGGTWPWSFEALPVGRTTAGLGRSPYLAGGAGAERAAGALAFGTLERYLTWPVLQGSLHALARRAGGRRVTDAEVAATVSAAAGQDLSWFFDQAFDARRRFDYGVTALDSQAVASCDGSPCYRTRVTIASRGDGMFTGSSRSPAGAYEAGDAMVLRITFSDGQVSSLRWDGRGASRTFELDRRHRGPARSGRHVAAGSQPA
jgi:hypothetical protein